jgi:hypothetical protein
MTFEEILHQAVAMLQHRGRFTYRALKAQFQSSSPCSGSGAVASLQPGVCSVPRCDTLSAPSRDVRSAGAG